MKRMQIAFLIVTFASLFAFTTAFAQTEGLILRLSRDFGYGGFNNDIQGLFSMKVTGPADLVRVVFYIDSTAIGEVTQAPFNLQFNTDNYPLGQHKLSAVGYSTSGQEYSSNVIIVNFVPASSSTKVILPILVVVFGAILLSFIIPIGDGKGKTQNLPLGAERKYGLGGGICPKCHRPFALPIFQYEPGIFKIRALSLLW